MRTTSSLRRILPRAIYAMAALVLGLGPTLDAVAGAADLAVERGNRSSILMMVAAFDVIDDTLDHLPGKSGGEPQLQQIAVPPAATDLPVAPSQAANDHPWTPQPERPLPSRLPERLDRPPRV